MKMAPTSEEELKLRLFTGDISQLGPAERFLKAMVEIPFAFKRMEALLFMGNLKEELTATRDSFAILEVRSLIFTLQCPHSFHRSSSLCHMMIMTSKICI